MKIRIQPGLDHIKDRADLLQDFVVFACKDLQCMPCDIDIVNGREDSSLKTTAQYDPNNHHVMVNAKNRHFGDVLRSVGHELVHHKQNLSGELEGPIQDVGGDIEDEANARAGAMLKSFAYQEGPERIYEGVDLLKAYAGLLIEQGMSMPGTPSPNQTQPSATPATTPGLAAAQKTVKLAKQGKEVIDKATKATRDFFRRMSKSKYDEYIGVDTAPKAVVEKSGFVHPAPGAITSDEYGRQRATSVHRGIDVRYERGETGQDILASAAGSVAFAGKMRGYGNVVIVNHLLDMGASGFAPAKTLYAHLEDIYAKTGDQVVPGTVVGTLGKSGGPPSMKPHLHFEIHVGSPVKDPDSDNDYDDLLRQWDRTKLPSKNPRDFIKFSKSKKEGDEEACKLVWSRIGGKGRTIKMNPAGCGPTFDYCDRNPSDCE